MSDTPPVTPFAEFEAKVAEVQPEPHAELPMISEPVSENAAVVDPGHAGSVEREPSHSGAPTAADVSEPLPPPFVGRTELTVIEYVKAWVRREIALHADGRDTQAENP